MLHYESHGSGPETIVFAHGLLFSGRMFDDQVRALEHRYRCVTFDFPGQGKSEVTESGYDMDSLTNDAAALIETLQCAPCHFVGLSMGGFIAFRVAIRRPELLKSIIVLGTSADPEPADKRRQFLMMNFIARWFGLRSVAGRVTKVLFAPRFRHDPNRAELRRQWRERILGNDRIGLTRAVRAVLDRDGVYEDLDKIALPTLIIVGEDDTATPPAKSERIHARIRGSELVRIPAAGHSTTIEEPEAVNRAMIDFLSRH